MNMIKHLSILALLAVMVLPAFGKDMKTVTVKLPTLQCGMCKKTIEARTQGIAGIDSLVVDVEEKTATVVFDADVITLAAIETAISKAGYDANETPADKRAQKKLHPCCQPGAHD